MLQAANPQADYGLYGAEIDTAIQAVLDGPSYILGPYVKIFESKFGHYIGGNCVGVGCGTDALILSMRALGIGAGDEVIVPAFVPLPVVSAVVAVGAIPMIVDVRERDLTIDPHLIHTRGRTKAIIAVHIFGNPCDMVYSPGIPVIEDISQATGGYLDGKMLGSLGMIAAASFYPTKPLGAIGDAGAVVTRMPYLAGRVRQMRQYGWNQDRLAQHYVGRCTRLDELQAAILTVKLAHLEEMNAARIHLAETYRQRLRSLDFCHDTYSVYHQCVVRVPYRDQLREYLKENDINTSIHYPTLPWQHPAYKKLCVVGECPVATRAAREVLSLPLWAGMPLDQAKRVCAKIREFFDRRWR